MRTVIAVLCGISVCLNACCLSAEDVLQEVEPTVTLRSSNCRCRQCFVAETTNFRIQYCTSAERLRELAIACERLKSHSQSTWLNTASATWQPRCEVVVHATVETYSRLLGPGSERTSGCATIRLHQGRVAERRIDVRADADGWLSDTLPHELTHVVLADRFTQQRIPPWADEGIAMLAESPDKLHRRLLELRNVIESGKTQSLSRIVAQENAPSVSERAAFYGQSLTLTGLLLEQGTPQQLLEFVEAARRVGHEQALRDVYAITSWSTLESEWQTYAASQRLRRLTEGTQPNVEVSRSSEALPQTQSAGTR
jgi:hypothetical protein